MTNTEFSAKKVRNASNYIEIYPSLAPFTHNRSVVQNQEKVTPQCTYQNDTSFQIMDRNLSKSLPVSIVILTITTLQK